MKLRKLPIKTEKKNIVIVTKFLSIDRIKIELPDDALGLFESLLDTSYPMTLVRIYGKSLAASLIKCGLIKNGNRGRGGDTVIMNGKYYCTAKFRNNYKQLIRKISEILES